MDKHKKKKKKKKTKTREISPKTWLGIINPRRNLIARLVCFFILPTLALLLISLLVVSFTTYADLEQSIGETLEISAQVSKKLFFSVTTRIVILELISKHGNLNVTPWNLTLIETQLRRSAEAFSALLLAATNGTVVASSHSNLIGEDVSSMKWFQEGLTEGVYFGSPPPEIVYTSAYDLDTVPPNFRRFLELSIPIRETTPEGETGELLGVLGGFLYWEWAREMSEVPESLFSPWCRNQLNVTILAYSEPTQLVLDPSLYGAGTRPVTDYPELLAAIENPNLNHVQTVYNGTPYLIGFSFCPPNENVLGLDLLLAVPAEEIVSPITQSRLQLIVVGAAVTLFGAGLGLLLALSVVDPISKIVQSTNAILKEAQRPESEKEKEEIGTAAPAKVVDEVKTYLNKRRFWAAPPTDEVKVLLNALEKLARALTDETELKEKTMALEEDTKKRTAELLSTTKQLELESEERRVMEAILYNIIPYSVASRLISGEKAFAERYEMVTLVFVDIVEFTNLANTMSAEELMNVVNEVFSEYDKIATKFSVEPIKTIGDAYFACAGLIPGITYAQAQDCASRVLQFALEVVALAQQWKLTSFGYKRTFDVRVGINTGPVSAGIIATRKIAFDLWGEAVNIAARMESHSVPGKIQVSQATYQLTKNLFLYESRGQIPITARTKMNTYWLQGKL